MSRVQSHLWPLLRVLIGPASVSLLLAGCLTSLQGDPKRLYTIDEENNEMRAVVSLAIAPPPPASASLNAIPLSEADFIARRNQIITARMYAIDINFHEFESALRRERQQIGFWSTAASVGLTGSATMIVSAATKTALAAAATILTGSTAAYKDEVLFHKTIDILFTQMQARRAIISASIIEKLNRSTVEYPLGLALTDVEAYYAAGTINSALVELGKTVGDEARAADEIKLAAVNLKFSPDNESDLLKRFVYPSGLAGGADPAAFKKVSDLMLKLRNIQNLTTQEFNAILGNPNAALLRRQLVDALKLR